MWTAIGTAVLKGVVDHVLTPDNSTNSTGSSNYKPHPPQNGLHQNQFYHSSPQMTHRCQQVPTACSNCQSSSNGSSKPRTNNNFSKNQKNGSSFCTIKIQKNSDLEIKIKKTQTQMANMNIKVRNNAQKASVPGSSNLNDQRQNNSMNKGNKYKEKGLKSNKTIRTGNIKLNTNNNAMKDHKSEPSNTRSTWMYLGRLKIGTTEADIHSYLIEKFPACKFKVESLPLYKDGKLPCFKVLVDNGILTEFQDLSHWPQGVKVTKYHHNFKIMWTAIGVMQ